MACTSRWTQGVHGRSSSRRILLQFTGIGTTPSRQAQARATTRAIASSRRSARAPWCSTWPSGCSSPTDTAPPRSPRSRDAATFRWRPSTRRSAASPDWCARSATAEPEGARAEWNSADASAGRSDPAPRRTRGDPPEGAPVDSAVARRRRARGQTVSGTPALRDELEDVVVQLVRSFRADGSMSSGESPFGSEVRVTASRAATAESRETRERRRPRTPRKLPGAGAADGGYRVVRREPVLRCHQPTGFEADHSTLSSAVAIRLRPSGSRTIRVPSARWYSGFDELCDRFTRVLLPYVDLEENVEH